VIRTNYDVYLRKSFGNFRGFITPLAGSSMTNVFVPFVCALKDDDDSWLINLNKKGFIRLGVRLLYDRFMPLNISGFPL
jgi:hypothetical protein